MSNDTFESFDIESLYLHIRCNSRKIQVSYMKVIGSMLRAQERKRSLMPVDALINFSWQFASVLARWHHSPIHNFISFLIQFGLCVLYTDGASAIWRWQMAEIVDA